MTLKTLEEFNHEMLKEYYPAEDKNKNGIACPKCGEELYDTDGVVLLLYPPQKKIHCAKCDYEGRRVC